MNATNTHYFNQIIIPTYFLWSLILYSISRGISRLFKAININVIFLILLLGFLFPKVEIINDYTLTGFSFSELSTQLSKNVYSKGDIGIENYINSKTNKNDCVISVYAWKVSETFLYSQRRPCSRFLIPNIVNDEWQKIEYRKSLEDNPPSAIVYSLDLPDYDVITFEKRVFNFPKVLKNCYFKDEGYKGNYRWQMELYFPVYNNKARLSECIKNHSGDDSL